METSKTNFSENAIFLFVVVHTYDQNNNTIEANIINVFESVGIKNNNKSFTNSFKLATSYSKDDGFVNTLGAKNYITVEQEGIQSKISKRGEFNINNDHIYNTYKNFETIVEGKPNRCVFFYEYDNDGNILSMHYTKGSIFIYNNGIGSTSSIHVGESSQIENFEFIKNVILEDNVFKLKSVKKPVQEEEFIETSTGPVSQVNTNSVSKKPVSAEPSQPITKQVITKPVSAKPVEEMPKKTRAPIDTPKYIREKVQTAPSRGPAKPFKRLGGGATTDYIQTLKSKCRDASILYANTILPDALFDIIINIGLTNNTNSIFRTVINQLYIDITAPTTVADFENYNKLYEKIDMYYRDKNKLIESPIYDNELKKEMKQFNESLKINKYIEFMNKTREQIGIDTKYENLYFIMHITDFLDFLDYLKIIYKNDKTKPEFKEIEKIIQQLLEKSYINIKSKILPSIMDHIKQKLEETTNGIYTYLKISNFQEDGTSNFNSPYNQRFNIKINNDKRSIVMEYSNVNFGLYNKDTTVDTATINLKRDQRIILKMGKDGKPMNEIESIAYDGKYTFGNFNKVFDPRYTVKDIANELKPLVDKVVSGKPLFLMGWGASGSGKTSTLISLAKKNEPGVLVYLCNMLGEKGYTTLTLSCKELYQPYYYKENKQNVLPNPGLGVLFSEDERPTVFDETISGLRTSGGTKLLDTEDPVVEQYDSFIFNYSENEREELNKFKLNSPSQYRTHHKYRTQKEEFRFEPGENIGTIINYVISTDRLVKATTNNPVSSRSHVLCFLKLKNDKKEANIIIGDLAGVENIFNCESPREISKFFNIKREGTTERFYKDEITQDGKVDVIYGGEQPQTLNETDKDNFQDSMSRPFFVFNKTNILRLYNYGEKESKFGSTQFYSPPNAIEMFVNLILRNVNQELTIDNLNEKILTMEKIKIEEFKPDILTYRNEINAEPNLTIRKMIYGVTNNQYENKVGPSYYNQKIFSTIWNKNNIDILLNKINESILYNNVIKNICKHRVAEGKFINKSLVFQTGEKENESLSTDIMNIVNYKNRSNVYFAPSFENSCLPAYCPSGKMCFSIEKNVKFDINSLIMKEIIKELNYTDYKRPGPNDNVLKEQFYEDIEFCLFCVFNWSRTANNPPPVPYVDINQLKQMIYRDNQSSFDMDKFKLVLKTRIDELERNKYSSDALRYLKIIQGIVGAPQDKKIAPGKISGKATLDAEDQRRIKEQLEKIDNTNATTAVGTIEFVDRLSKLNGISNSCFEKQNEQNYRNIYE